MNTALKKSGRAFTLVEMMIAVTLFTMVMASIYSSWKVIINGTHVALNAAASAQRGRVALHAVEQALLTVQLYSDNGRYYSFVVDSSEQFAAIQMTSRLPASFLGSGYFGSEVVRRVTFFVEKGEDNLNNLVMTQVPLLDASERRDPYKIILARDVTRFDMEFWKTGDREFTTDFLQTNQLPRLVRVCLGIGHSATDSTLPNQYMMRLVNVPSEQVTTRF